MHNIIFASHAVIVLKESLLESGLSILEQQAISTNSVLKLANGLAHTNHSKDVVQSFMKSHGVGPYEIANAWYRAGNGESTHLLNHVVATRYCNDYSGNHKFMIDGNSVHDHLVHDDMLNFLKTTHQNTTNDIRQRENLPESFKLYRGVDLTSNQYSPRPLESWTTDKATAHAFSKTHILIATFDAKDVIWHYLHGEDNSFIPPEREVKGKEEHVVFGHRANNLLVIPKSNFNLKGK